ncbi:MAG: hypothetical protein LC799_13755, partial [Actinobacteria bacterium]|nr:hypothetical protein [Actinomycetota bacterium]
PQRDSANGVTPQAQRSSPRSAALWVRADLHPDEEPLLCVQPHTPRGAVIRHADKISGQAGDTPPIDPALFERDDVRRVLAALDIGTLYRVLGNDAGISQRQIAVCTGSPSPR